MRKSFTLLSLVMCAGLFADTAGAGAQPSFTLSRGDEPLKTMPMTDSYPAAYNAPGTVNLSDGWDVYVDASYIYWYAKEEGLDIATLGHYYDIELWEPATAGGTVIFQDAKYTSGFKVGLGANLGMDDWVVDLNYTYLRQKTNTDPGTATAPTGETGLYNLSGWFQPNYYGGQAVAYNFSSEWKMHLDWLDLQFSRPYYQSRRLVITPSAGLRASWIRQDLDISSPGVFNAYEFVTETANTSTNHSRSWAIGPRALVDLRWLVGSGFRFQGNMGGSLLYTQYTSISHTEGPFYDGATSTGGVDVSFSNYSCVRPMVEANLGLGWGTYLSQNKYHFDLSATYDFNYLWSQNMMRYLLGASSVSSTSGAPGDLFLHGLEIKARFDF